MTSPKSIPPSPHFDLNVLHKELSYTNLLSRNVVSPPSVSSRSIQVSDTSTPQQATLKIALTLDRDSGLPDWIKSIDSRVKSEDLHYLKIKGALSLPDKLLLDELVRCLIEHVHPALPVLDLQAFLRSVGPLRGPMSPKISVLLFQAVMMAAMPFADDRIVKRAGFQSRLAAREGLYTAAKESFAIMLNCRTLLMSDIAAI